MKQEKTQQTKTTSWKVVFAALVILPFVLALALNTWLGVSKESTEDADIFRRLGVQPTPLVESNSFLFGQMFFARFRVETNSLAGFVESLDGFEEVIGRPREPVSFALKRDWWDMDQAAEGVGWDRGGVHLWRSNLQPDLFYAVVELAQEGR